MTQTLRPTATRLQESAPVEAVLRQLKQNGTERAVEDAFVVPGWFADQRSWVLEPSRSNSVSYNLPLCLRIRGQIAHSALQAALQYVQQRHQPLRSIFRVEGQTLVQVVLAESRVELSSTDVAGWSESEAETLAFQRAREDVNVPFDLARDAAFRARLYRMAPEHHILLVTTHHLVCDDWSTGILLQELMDTYTAITEGRFTPGASAAFTYADFIRWYESQLQSSSFRTRAAQCRNRLHSTTPFNYVPEDRQRPTTNIRRGRSTTLSLPESLTASLGTLSQRERVSLFMTLLSGFLQVLHSRSGREDVAVSTCAANRCRTEIEGLVGRFANDLVVRTDMSGNPTIRELLARVRKEALTSYGYQDIPFAGLIAEAGHGQPAKAPSFQVMFILQDAPKEKLHSSSLSVEQLPFPTGTAKFDLCVLLDIQNGIKVTVEYDSDLFEDGTISQMLQEYESTLSAMARDPESRISSTDSPRPATAKLASIADRSVAAGRTRIESQLIAIWEQEFRQRPIRVDDDFFQLGGNSLLASKLFAHIERVFKVRIPLVTLVEAPTIAKLAEIIGRSELRSSEYLVPIQPGGSRPTLFCVHGQSGNLLMYRALAQQLGPDQPVYGLQPQGIDGKQPPLTRIEDMAKRYVEAIRGFQRRGPYFLAGYCMGGLLALEMAQQFHSIGESIGLLAMLDTYNVHKVGPKSFGGLFYRLQKYWFGMWHFLLTNSGNKRQFLRQRLNELRDEVSLLSECNAQAAFGYVPKEYEGRILQVCPRHQYSIYSGAHLGWSDVARGGVEVLTLPIYPGQMFEEPNVTHLAAELRARIDRASQALAA